MFISPLLITLQVLMEENRSFDHLFGYAKKLLGVNGLDGSLKKKRQYTTPFLFLPLSLPSNEGDNEPLPQLTLERPLCDLAAQAVNLIGSTDRIRKAQR